MPELRKVPNSKCKTKHKPWAPPRHQREGRIEQTWDCEEAVELSGECDSDQWWSDWYGAVHC